MNCGIFQVKIDLFKMVAARKEEQDRRRPTLGARPFESNLNWEGSLNPINVSECFAEQCNDFLEKKRLSISTMQIGRGIIKKNNFLVYE